MARRSNRTGGRRPGGGSLASRLASAWGRRTRTASDFGSEGRRERGDWREASCCCWVGRLGLGLKIDGIFSFYLVGRMPPMGRATGVWRQLGDEDTVFIFLYFRFLQKYIFFSKFTGTYPATR